jgi:hypothetical protein
MSRRGRGVNTGFVAGSTGGADAGSRLQAETKIARTRTNARVAIWMSWILERCARRIEIAL